MEKQWGTLETDPLEVPEYKGLLGYPFSFGGVNEYADGYEEDDSDNPNSMSVDSQGNLAVGGDFLGAAIDFSPHNSAVDTVRASTKDLYYTADAYVARYRGDTGELMWVLTFGGRDSDKVNAVCATADGYIYATGSFEYEMTVTGTAGNSTTLQTSGYALNGASGIDLFLIKFANDGELVWAKSIGGFQGEETGRALAVDESGNVYLGGYFGNHVDFDDSDGEDSDDTRTVERSLNFSARDGFVARYGPDASFHWVKRLGGLEKYDVVSALHYNGADLLVGGTIQSQSQGIQFDDNDADSEFNPTAGFPDGTLAADGDEFGFVQCLDPANGNRRWYACFLDNGTSDSESQVEGIGCDNAGNVYAAGQFDNEVDFNPDTSAGAKQVRSTSANNDEDIFIVKLTSSGALVWSRSIGGAAGDDTGDAMHVSAGANPTVYISGDFNGTIDADGQGASNDTITSAGDRDALILGLDKDGDLLWARQVGGDAYDTSDSFAEDQNGNVYVGGQHKITADLDVSAAVQNHTTEDMAQKGYEDARDAWIVKLSPEGATSLPPVLIVADQNYDAGQPAVVLDPSAVAGDSSDDQWDPPAKLTVQITNGAEDNDELSVVTSGGFSISSGNLSYGGTVVGTVAENSGAANDGVVNDGDLLTVNFTAQAANEIVRDLVRSVAYRSTGTNPSASKEVTFTLTDADGESTADVSTVTVASTGGQSEMGLKQGESEIADGGSYDFGTQSIGSTADVVFTIENAGDGDLELTVPLAVGGTDAAHFAIQSQPGASTLGPLETASFTVRFNPATVGSKTASVSIGNNDADEDPYDLVLEGEGAAVVVHGPEATTQSAYSVGQTTATLSGSVDPGGLSTRIEFQYGTDTGYGQTVSAEQSPVDGDSPVQVSATIGGLAPDTVYNFRVMASNANGDALGENMTFRTASSEPSTPIHALGEWGLLALALLLSLAATRFRRRLF